MVANMRERLAFPPALPQPLLALEDGLADCPPLMLVNDTYMSLATEINTVAMKYIQFFRPFDTAGDRACSPALARRKVARLCMGVGHSYNRHCRDLGRLLDTATVGPYFHFSRSAALYEYVAEVLSDAYYITDDDDDTDEHDDSNSMEPEEPQGNNDG